MLRLLLKPSLPGGLSFLEALGAGLAAGQDPSMQPDSVVNIEPTGNLFKSNITITPRTQGSLLSGQEVVQIGLKQALLMPKAAGGLLHRLPPAAYAMYEPIKNVGDFVSSPFRRGTLPRITGQEGLPTLGELIQDALAGARIPVGMPPSPLGPNGSLGSILALAAAGSIWKGIQDLFSPRPLEEKNPQIWGLLSGKPAADEDPFGDLDFNNESDIIPELNVTGRYSPTGRTVITASSTTGFIYDFYGVDEPREVSSGPFQTEHIGLQGVTMYRTSNSLGMTALRADGTTAGIGVGASGPSRFTSLNANISMSTIEADAVDFPPPGTSENAELPDRSWLFNKALETPAAPEPLPLPAYPPQPATVPAVPDAEPVTQPEPATPAQPPQRIAPPVTVPSSPPWVTPSRPGSTPGSVPGQFPSQNPTQPTQPTAPDGTVTPTQPGPVTQTQPGSIVPWPGAPSIPAIGPAPRPDLQGIAQEVGRIERKIDLMNTPGSGQNGFENLGELLGLLEQIWSFLSATASGTTYTLDSPCEVDEEGIKLPPIEIEAPGASTTFQALLNRTDALAELIQAHKNLKQPGCKHKLAGEIVTVNFQQIE
jgi:hypothetical protein